MKLEYDFSKGRRGPVVAVPAGKTRITIRIDDDILDWFREQVTAAGGGNYQTLINLALREYIRRRTEPLEGTLRRVIREELKESASAIYKTRKTRQTPAGKSGGQATRRAKTKARRS